MLGCASDDRAARSADTSAPIAQAADTAPAGSDTGCVLALPWRNCSVLDRLERAGLAPQERGPVRQPFFTVEGRVYVLGDAELQTFVFADTVAAAAQAAALDSVRVSPPTMAIAWRRKPTLIRSSNLVAILLSDDERQTERVSLAIGAGLPATP